MAATTVVAKVEPLHAQQPSHVAIGDLDLAYDATRWRVVTTNEGVVATCIQKLCDGVAVVGRATAGASHCDTLVAAYGGRFRLTATALPGSVLVFAEIDLGCRNLMPARVSACARTQTGSYRFESGPHTCRSAARTGTTQAVIELLKGLTAPRAHP